MTCILPLGGDFNLQFLNTNIPCINIPINVWIHLYQNHFIGIHDVDFFETRYKIPWDSNIPILINYFKLTWKKNGILVFYNDVITRELWDTINKLWGNACIIVGLTRKNKTSSTSISSSSSSTNNIFIIQDDDIYTRDAICSFLNQFLLKY